MKKDNIESPDIPNQADTVQNNNPPPVDSSSTLEIRITNFPNQNGNINLALFSNESDFDNKTNPLATIITALSGDTMVLETDSLLSGDYAFSVYHDENSNSQPDQNFLGIPTEYFGFSNNAMGIFGPPTFSQAKFSCNGKDDLLQQIALIHF